MKKLLLFFVFVFLAFSAFSYNYNTNPVGRVGATAHSHDWNDIDSPPTTLGGYGITDAMSSSSPANGIASSDISNWNTAYGWGNWALAGFITNLTSFTTDNLAQGAVNFYANITQQANGQTAYGWGNWALNFGSTIGTITQGNDSRLSDARTPLAHNQTWATITSTPTTLSGYGITDAVNQTAIFINTTAPITGGGNLSASRTIAMPQANATQNGFLDSGNFTTFNNKLSTNGSAAALTSIPIANITGSSLPSGVTGSSLTSTGTLANVTITQIFNVTGTSKFTGAVTISSESAYTNKGACYKANGVLGYISSVQNATTFNYTCS